MRFINQATDDTSFYRESLSCHTLIFTYLKSMIPIIPVEWLFSKVYLGIRIGSRALYSSFLSQNDSFPSAQSKMSALLALAAILYRQFTPMISIGSPFKVKKVRETPTKQAKRNFNPSWLAKLQPRLLLRCHKRTHLEPLLLPERGHP